MRLRDAGAGVLPQEFEAHDRRIDALSFYPDGSRLLTTRIDGKLILWDP